MDNITITANKVNNSMKITLSRLPKTLEDLQNINKDNFKTPEFAPALFIACLTNFERNVEETMKMIDYLNGPNTVSPMDKQFYLDRLIDKYYKPFSYFEGTNPENNYTPTIPYTIYVKSNIYTDQNAGYKQFLMKSSGADNERTITVRQKQSNGYWYLNTENLLSDIRIPSNEDPWN